MLHVFFLLSVFLATSTHAQSSASGSVSSGSGSLSWDHLQQQTAEREWEERLNRTTDFRQKTAETEAEQRKLHRDIQKNRATQATHRLRCRERIRAANKFTKFRTELQCYQQDLEHTLDRLDQEEQLLTLLPGIDSDRRSLALSRLALLRQAHNAIIAGIESGVFSSTEELLETKLNLHRSYLESYWLQLSRVHADWLQRWTESSMVRVIEIAEATEPTEETATVLLQALSCLQTAETQLLTATKASALADAQGLSLTAQTTLRHCLELFAEANALHADTIEE